MPRKTKITAVPVDQPEGEGLARAWGEEEGKTDAEQMTDIINEVSLEQKLETLPEEPQVTEKAKPKRASRAKPKEPPQEEPKEEPPKEEPPKEEPPKEEQGAGAKVECPDCGKQMSAKTLRYSHGANCSAKQGKQQRAQEEQPEQNVMNDLIEYEVQRRMNQKRAERATRREAMVAKLLQNAF